MTSIKISVFDFKSYKKFLRQALGGEGTRTGLRKKAAIAMQMQTTYLSQILNGEAHLSMEQAFSLSSFLGLDSEEREFLLLLVQTERAGRGDLRNYFQEKIQLQLEKRTVLRERLQSQEGLSVIDQAIYYSKWYYACLHVMISIPELQTKDALSKHLGLPLSLVSEAMEFLETRGLAAFENGRYKIGPRHLHLPHDSPHITKHHSNWRLRALDSLDQPQKNDVHYSVVWTLSKADAEKIKQLLVDHIQATMKVVRDSKEENTFAFALDYFEI